MNKPYEIEALEASPKYKLQKLYGWVEKKNFTVILLGQHTGDPPNLILGPARVLITLSILR